jgi:YHS domain-containing protein
MKSNRKLSIIALLAGLVLTGSALAKEPANPESALRPAATQEPKAKPYPLDFCLVSDEKFEGSDMKPFELVHEGQTIKFCCKSCVKDFKKEPKKLLTKMANEVKKRDAAKVKK